MLEKTLYSSSHLCETFSDSTFEVPPAYPEDILSTREGTDSDQHLQMLFRPRGSKYKRLKASHPVATCPQSSSSTDATITVNNHKEPKCIGSGMSVYIGGPIHAPDSDDDVDSNWDERLAPFMLAVATPNFGKAHGTSPPPHYQRNSSPSHDHSLTTDEFNYPTPMMAILVKHSEQCLHIHLFSKTEILL